ncbi:hypothetical protein VOLCADRAFT_66384, partial [Volvox carteri f. nagariensis]
MSAHSIRIYPSSPHLNPTPTPSYLHVQLLEYCPRDLQSELRKHPAGLPSRNVKLLAWELLQALRFMHSKKILHRDLKPANLLLSTEGVLKVCDFGLARSGPLQNPRIGNPGDALSSYVVTRWYRAPEILLNKPYGTASDIWSAGCVIAEMALGAPLIPGSSSVDQIFQIWRLLGSLQQPSCRHGMLAAGAPSPLARRTSSLQTRLGTHLGTQLLDLLEAALRTNPHERATAEELLCMPYFKEI